MIAENSHPLEQQAKHKLDKLKLKPEPHRLFSLQLMLWALDKGKSPLKTEASEGVESLIYQLLDEPKQAHQVLGFLPGNARVTAEELQELDPEAAASELLWAANLALEEENPAYL
jgi:hypothetical protein